MKLRALVLGLLCASPLVAAPRTFVSPAGLDTNPCSLTLPCRTFQAAVNVTDNEGEVVAIGSAGFGPVTINQSITITAPSGVYAGIASTGSTAVAVNAGAVRVVLRGLALNGGQIGNDGVTSLGGTVRIESCTIAGFAQHGVFDYGAVLFVTDTLLRDNNTGIYQTSGTATIDHVRLENNSSSGFYAYGASSVIHDSLASENGSGFVFTNNGATSAIGFLDNCIAANNTNGFGEVSSILLLRNCTATRNGYGFYGSAGTVYSQGNNSFNLNVTANISGATFTAAPSS